MFTRRLSRKMLATVALMCIIFGMFALLPCVLCLEVTLATAAMKVLLGLFVVAMKRLCATVAMKLRCFIGMFAWASKYLCALGLWCCRVLIQCATRLISLMATPMMRTITGESSRNEEVALGMVHLGMVVMMVPRRLSWRKLATVALMLFIFGMIALLPWALCLKTTLATAAMKVSLCLVEESMDRVCATVAMKLLCFTGMLAWTRKRLLGARTAALKVLLGLFEETMDRVCATVAMKLMCFIGMLAWTRKKLRGARAAGLTKLRSVRKLQHKQGANELEQLKLQSSAEPCMGCSCRQAGDAGSVRAAGPGLLRRPRR